MSGQRQWAAANWTIARIRVEIEARKGVRTSRWQLSNVLRGGPESQPRRCTTAYRPRPRRWIGRSAAFETTLAGPTSNDGVHLRGLRVDAELARRDIERAATPSTRHRLRECEGRLGCLDLRPPEVGSGLGHCRRFGMSSVSKNTPAMIGPAGS